MGQLAGAGEVQPWSRPTLIEAFTKACKLQTTSLWQSRGGQGERGWGFPGDGDSMLDIEYAGAVAGASKSVLRHGLFPTIWANQL